MRPLSISRIEEPQVRDNFKVIEDELSRSPIANGEWRLYDKVYESTGTFQLNHKLGFKPLDIIITHQAATVSVDLTGASEFTIAIMVTVPGRVRFLLGRMK